MSLRARLGLSAPATDLPVLCGRMKVLGAGSTLICMRLRHTEGDHACGAWTWAEDNRPEWLRRGVVKDLTGAAS